MGGGALSIVLCAVLLSLFPLCFAGRKEEEEGNSPMEDECQEFLHIFSFCWGTY